MTSTREIFRSLWRLQTKQPWLSEVSENLETLLYEECSSDGERDLVFSLLERFEFISTDRERKLLTELAEEIATDPELDEESTCIAASGMDSSSDSSQVVLYALKTLFPKLPWEPACLVSHFKRTFSKLRCNPSLTSVVIVDEFLGTGQTLIGRINAIRQQCAQAGHPFPNIKARYLVATSIGLENCGAVCDDVKALITIKRGMSDHYAGAELSKNVSRMEKLESTLGETYRDIPLPNFGYQKSEALYCRYGGNTPNNVFPIFWWPIYFDSTKRNPILVRAL